MDSAINLNAGIYQLRSRQSCQSRTMVALSCKSPKGRPILPILKVSPPSTKLANYSAPTRNDTVTSNYDTATKEILYRLADRTVPHTIALPGSMDGRLGELQPKNIDPPKFEFFRVHHAVSRYGMDIPSQLRIFDPTSSATIARHSLAIKGFEVSNATQNVCAGPPWYGTGRQYA